MLTKTIFFLSLLLLSACAPAAALAPTPIPAERPPDFQVQYYWSTGSLPPIYYYNYSISIGPEARDSIVFKAGYNGDEAPVWMENFPVSESDLDSLYTSLQQARAFSESWQQMEDIPDGGSVDSLDLTAWANTYAIPSYIEEGEQASAMHAVYGMIEHLVPQEIWDDLYAKHDEYVMENEE